MTEPLSRRSYQDWKHCINELCHTRKRLVRDGSRERFGR